MVFPFSTLSPSLAYIFWSVLSLGCLVATITLSLRILEIPNAWLVRICAVILLWPPFLHHIRSAQFTLMVTLLCYLSFALQLRGKQIFSGALLGLAVMVKLFPAILIVFYLGCRRWKTLMAMLLTICLGVWIVGLYCLPGDFVTFFKVQMPLSAQIYGPHPLNISLAGLFHRAFDSKSEWVTAIYSNPVLAPILTNVCIIFALVGIYLSAKINCIETRSGSLLPFCLSLFAMVLVSPVSWSHSLLILLFPILLVGRQVIVSRDWSGGSLLALSLLLMSLSDDHFGTFVVSYFEQQPFPPISNLLFSLGTLGVILLMALLLISRTYPPPPSSPNSSRRNSEIVAQRKL